MVAVPKQPKPIRDEKYLRHVAALPCIVCEKPDGDAAHFRLFWFRGGQKPSDAHTYPLCRESHTEEGKDTHMFWVRVFNERPDILAEVMRGWMEFNYRQWKEGS